MSCFLPCGRSTITVDDLGIFLSCARPASRLFHTIVSIMETLTDIEAAADALPLEDKQRLVRHLVAQLDSQHGSAALPAAAKSTGHSILDIEPVRLGAILKPLTSDDDVLAEMLEGRT